MPARSAASGDDRARGATLIVAAMPEELSPLRARLTGAHAHRVVDDGQAVSHELEIWTGLLGGQPVILAVTGDGERNARQGIAAVLNMLGTMPPSQAPGQVAGRPAGRVAGLVAASIAAPARVDRLIAVGVAGALSADLGAGALVVSDRVTSEGGETLLADATLVARAVAAVADTGARRGLVMTTGRIIDTIDEKRRLLGVASAGSEAVVVDLESLSYARAAARAGIPWVVLRAVSDTAREALPPLLNRCRDPGGSVRRGRVALELIGNPGALPILLSLRQRVRECAQVLARATEIMLVDATSAHFASPSPAPAAALPQSTSMSASTSVSASTLATAIRGAEWRP